VERTGYPHGKKPWLRRESPFQRTVVDDYVDIVVVLSVVLVGLAIAAFVLLARA
jgi:hypothetical protein